MAVVDSLHQRIGAFGNRCWRKVVDHQDLRFGTSALEGVSGIVFAVGAREYRDDNARLRERFAANQRKLFRPANLLNLFTFTAIREYGFDAALPSFLQLRHADDLTACRKLVGFGGAAKFGNGYQIGIGGNLSIVSELDNEAAISQAEQIVCLNFI